VGRVVRVGQGYERRDRSLKRGPELPEDSRDHGERAFGADEQRGDVVSRVVLGKPVESLDDRSVGENRLEAGDASAGGSVAQRTRSARVACNQSSDRGAITSAEIQGRVESRLPCVVLQRPQCHAGPYLHEPAGVVDRREVLQALQRQEDLATARHSAADEPGVAALRDDGYSGGVAAADYAGHLR